MTAASPGGGAENLSGPYDSPREPPIGGFNLRGMWALYCLTLRQHLHGKRWIIMAALFLLPAALAILIRASHGGATSSQLEFLLVFMLIPEAVLPLVALIYASGIISDEQEEQTITYLLIRPIPKWAIYIVKLKATLTTTVVLTIVFTLLTYAAIYVGAGATAREYPAPRRRSGGDPRPGGRRLLLPVRAVEPADQACVAGGRLVYRSPWNGSWPTCRSASG